MKTYLLKPLFLFCFISLFTISRTIAQDQSGNLLKAGVTEGNKLINAYLSTTMDGVAQGVNDGWHNTAKPLGPLGIDLRVNVGLGLVFKNDQSYNFNAIGLNTDHSKPYLVLEPGADPNRPTIYGTKEAHPPVAIVRANVAGMDTEITRFVMPTGVGATYSPTLPMIQLSVGLMKKTELNLRFFPRIEYPENYHISLLGIGLKHDLVQWIPKYKYMKLEDKRPFDLSVFAGFTSFNSEYIKTILAVDRFAYNPDPSIRYDNQKISFTGKAFTFGFITSKEFTTFRDYIGITPYLGVNYSYSRVRLQYEGDYPVIVPNDEYPDHPQMSKIQRVTTPIDLTGYVSNFRANVGARIKLFALTLSGEYSFGQISTITAAAAINIQSIQPFKL